MMIIRETSATERTGPGPGLMFLIGIPIRISKNQDHYPGSVFPEFSKKISKTRWSDLYRSVW